MKRLALLSLAALMLAATVFAPAATAQAPGEIDIQSVTLEPSGWVTVTGTIQCVEGYYYQGGVEVLQRSTGNRYLGTHIDISGTCETTGPQTFTAAQYESSWRAFHKGPSVVRASFYFCPPDHPGPFFTCENTQVIEEMPIR